MLFKATAALLAVVSAVSAAPAGVSKDDASSLGSRAVAGSPSFLGGLNIAGFDFGMTIYGYSGTYQAPPIDQITHFVNEGANVIRLPFGWQYMEPNGPGSGLSSSFFALYDSYVQKALSLNAYVLIDLHNYARWNGNIVGQSSITDAQFVAFWSSMAKKYASKSKVIFGLMNEPHDLTISTWANTVQKAVNGIRAAGAKTQYILLPGTGFTGGSSFVSTNEPALSAVTDPVGGTSLLVYDIHQYLNSDYSGSSAECVTNGISQFFAPIQAVLKAKGRKAFFSEIGGGNTASCETNLKAALAYLAGNPGQFLGWTAWAAGSFPTSYTLSLTPNADGSDQPVWTDAIKPNLPGNF